MAQRFGGPNSPGGDPRLQGPSGPTGARVRTRSRSPVGPKSHLLFVVPFIWAATAFFGDASRLFLNLGVFALLMFAAWLTREGVIAHAAYNERRIARRPAFPRKIAGSVFMGLGLALAGWNGLGLVTAGALGALGAGLHLIAFGPDPMRDKGIDGVDDFQTDRAARAITEAERHLGAMTQAIGGLRDRALSDRLRGFIDQARPLLRAVEDDPRHLSAARRYLGLYLDGAREATVKFADLYARNRDQAARDEYLALLDDLQRNFALRVESLQNTDRQALDIEMEVLRERLEREGVRPETPRLSAAANGADTAIQKGS